MTRGGARIGAGRPKNEVKTICYHRRVKPEWVKRLDAVLNGLKAKDDGYEFYCGIPDNEECAGTLDCFECEYCKFVQTKK